MAVESASFITGLNAANPLSSDQKSQGDDHLRLIKSVLLATFPNLSAAMTATAAQLNFVVGVTSAIQAQIDAKLSSASYTAADVLAKILANDGAGSGLDADLLDGQDGAFYRSAANLNAGTVPVARLPAIGTITGVTIQADPGGTPSGTYGQMFFYY